MTPSVPHHENPDSPTWSAVSDGGTTPANEEDHRQGTPGFFAPAPPTNLGASVPAMAHRETNTMGAGEDVDADNDPEGLETMGKEEEEEEKDYLKVETVYGDSEDEKEDDESWKEYHYCGAVYCLSFMSNGRLCGNKNCGWKTHLAKVAAGQRGEEGWFLYDTKNASPKQLSLGNFHLLAKSYQSDDERKAQRTANLEKMAQVTQSLGTLAMEGTTMPPDVKPDLKPPPSMMDPMLDVPEEDGWEAETGHPKSDMKDSMGMDSTSPPKQNKAASRAQVLQWLADAEVAAQPPGPNQPSSGTPSGKGWASQGTTKVEAMKVEALTQMLANEKQARVDMEVRMMAVMMEAHREALKDAQQVWTDETAPKQSKTKAHSNPKGTNKVETVNSDSEDSAVGSGSESRCNSKESGYAQRNPSRATRKATAKWYVVVAGRQIGIYNSWDRARKYTEGYSKARFRAFKDFREAKSFFKGTRGEADSGCEYESDSDSSASEPDSTPITVTPAKSDRKKGPTKKKVRMASVDSDYETGDSGQSDFGEGKDSPMQRSSLKSVPTVGLSLTDVVSPTHAGADKSTTTNEVHGVNMANEAAAYRLLSPPGAGSEAERSLVNGALDVTAMPGKGINDYNSAETALQEISSTLAESLRGEQFQVRGRITEDHRWKNANKDHLRSIKTIEDLRESLELLHDIEEEAVANMENGWRAVLYEHMGFDDATVDLWIRVGILPNMIRNSFLHYRALIHEVEYMCNGGSLTRQAEIFLQHHATKLALIRTHRARTRLQLIWMSYTYLRDARAARFVSATLQTRQTDNLRLEMVALREMQTTRNPRNQGNTTFPNRQGGGQQPDGNSGPSQSYNARGSGTSNGDGELQCAGCKSKKIHPATGRRGCPFKEFTDTVARKMAKTCEELMTGGKSKHAAINEAVLKHQSATT
jgi:hypothetical protein